MLYDLIQTQRMAQELMAILHVVFTTQFELFVTREGVKVKYLTFLTDHLVFSWVFGPFAVVDFSLLTLTVFQGIEM